MDQDSHYQVKRTEEPKNPISLSQRTKESKKRNNKISTNKKINEKSNNK
jgi:hypothetical protein